MPYVLSPSFLTLVCAGMIPFSILVGLILSHTGGQQYREGDRKDNAEHFAHGRIFLYTLSLDLILPRRIAFLSSIPIPGFERI